MDDYWPCCVMYAIRKFKFYVPIYYQFDYFGWCSLKDIYLLKIGDVISERPQQMYIRVALTLTNTIEDFKEYFPLGYKKILKYKH